MNINNSQYNNKIKPNTQFLKDIKRKLPEFFDNNKFELNKFKSALSQNNVHELNDGYQLNFIGKDYARQEAGEMPHTVIIPDNEHNDKEINKNSRNLYFSGDNLEGLRHLQSSYYHKINAIYIDPPFNTGSDDFIYPDNFELSDNILQNKFNLTDDQLKHLKGIQGTSTHSAWLTFMYPRLFLAKKLLARHGLIFISIDDNEQADLKLLMNSIYGENDFVAQLAVEMSKTQGMKMSVAEKGEIVSNKQYILIYELNHNEDEPKRIPLFDYQSGYNTHFNKILINNKLIKLTDYIYKHYKTIIKKISTLTNYKFSLKHLGIFVFLSKTLKKFIKDNSCRIFQNNNARIKLPKNISSKIVSSIIPLKYNNYLLIRTSNGTIRQLIPLSKSFHKTDTPNHPYGRSLIRGDFWKGFNADMMNINKEGHVTYKNGKKPVRLIQQLLKWSGIKDGIVMDFFSGSATTADAVMRNNEKYGANNSYIMMQINTPIFKTKITRNGKKKIIISKGATTAYKKGFKTLDQIGLKRILNSSKGLIDKYPLVANKLDLGFKHFYIMKPNIKLLNNLSIKDLSFNNNSQQLQMFDPNNVINSFSSQYLNVPGKANGFDTILCTFLIDDGYGADAHLNYVNVAKYRLPIVDNERAYILSNTWGGKQTQKLLNLIGNDYINIQSVVIFKYTIRFADIKELENGLNQLDVNCIERF